MKEAYDLVGNNIKSLVKATWWAFAIYAILMAITLYFQLPDKQLHDWGLAHPWSSYILQTLIYLGTWIASFLAGASLWKWVNHQPLLRNLWRVALLTILSDVIMGVIMAIYPVATASLSLVWSIVIGCVSTIVALIIYLPFAHVMPAWLLCASGNKFHPWLSYKQGFRHLGSISLLGFLSLLIIGILSALILLPAIVLIWAQLSSQLGALNGDPLGVPFYFTPLLLLVLVASMFILFYVASWMLLALVYLYGSNVEKDKKGKES